MIRLIAIIDSKRGIGKNGTQPMHIARDEQRFTDLTTGQDVLMGYGTYRAIGHPLKNRNNFVATKDPSQNVPGCQVVPDIASFLKKRQKDLWVIGGGQVFAAAIDFADELYLTQIRHDFDCQVFFPEFADKFYLKDESDVMEQGELQYSFQTWARK